MRRRVSRSLLHDVILGVQTALGLFLKPSNFCGICIAYAGVKSVAMGTTFSRNALVSGLMAHHWQLLAIRARRELLEHLCEVLIQVLYSPVGLRR